MHENDSTDATEAENSEVSRASGRSPRPDRSGTGPGVDHSEGATAGGTRPRRRTFLEALSVSSLAALAGCPSGDTGDAGEVAPISLEPGERDEFGKVIRFQDVYAMEVGARSDGADARMTGRFHTGDQYLRFEHDGTEIETYLVDGTYYSVRGGECFEYPDVAGGDDGRAESVADAAESPELTMIETTTMDGRTVAVLELPAGGFEGFDEKLTYYVDVETRYMRRLEMGDTVVDYHSWGDVEPIEAPDVECRQRS